MEVCIKKRAGYLNFLADNGLYQINLSSNPSEENPSCSPMQLVLQSLAGCMSIDVMMILEKQKQRVQEYEVKVKGHRVDETPRVFHQIDLQVIVEGEVEEAKLKRAITLSAEKYCSVLMMLEKAAEIKLSYVLNGKAESLS